MGRCVQVEFVKERLSFTGEDTLAAKLLLNVMGAVAEFERAMLKERQREGIAIAKKAGVYRGRKPSLTSERIAELRARVCSRGEEGGTCPRVRHLARNAVPNMRRSLTKERESPRVSGLPN